jgi:uncharacterized protein (DUF2126 family)
VLPQQLRRASHGAAMRTRAAAARAAAASCAAASSGSAHWAWLAASAACTALSFDVRTGVVASWVYPLCALAAWFEAAAAADAAATCEPVVTKAGAARPRAPRLRFAAAFVAAQAAASTLALWGVLQGPGA